MAKADGAVAPVFSAHRQAVGPADDGTGSVQLAGAVCQQRTGSESVGVPGLLSYTAPHFRRFCLQRPGQGNGFNGINRKMDSAAVAGTPLGTGNLLWVPADDPPAAPIHIGDHVVIIF